MLTILEIIELLLSVAWFFAIAHIIMSWLINFGVLNTHQPIVGQLWDGLNRILEPAYARIRRILPDTGALDLAPLVFLLAIIIARMIISDAKRNILLGA
ncbi:MAG: YggT family protein [Pseudomonadota bacterium]